MWRTGLALAESLNCGDIVVHPFVIGALALGRMPERQRTLRHLFNLPHVWVALEREIFEFID